MTAQELVSADEAQKTLDAMAQLRAAGARDVDVATRERFARTVIALHADRRAASRLRAGLQQAVASQQVRTMIGWRCGVCGRAWSDHAPECWVGAAAATLDEDGAA